MGTFSSDVVAGTDATAQEYNDVRKDHVLGSGIIGTEAIVTTTATIDWSDKTKGKIRNLTLNIATTTLAFSNVTIGQTIILRLAQDATGGRLVTWPAGIIWDDGVAPFLSTGASKIDTFAILCTALNTYEGFQLGQNKS